MAELASAPGYIWDVSEIPVCDYCGDPATKTTPTSGIILCGDTDCAACYVSDNGDEIEWADIEECAECGNFADERSGIILEPCDGCSDVFCQDCLDESEDGAFCPSCLDTNDALIQEQEEDEMEYE